MSIAIPSMLSMRMAGLRRDYRPAGGTEHEVERVTSQAPADRPPVSPWIIAASVMLATFMEILDTSVANVALPHIAGSLAASNQEALWVLTSYLVSNAIILPATGWFAAFFGRKRFL